MQIIFLGTSSMVPTKERNQNAVLIRYKNEGILVDCGEGTQRQLKMAGVKLTSVSKILISHWHGDHVLGLPGLIQSMAASDYHGVLEVYGPKKTKDSFKNMFKTFMFDRNIDIKIKEVGSGVFFQNNDFSLEAMPLEHGIDTLGFNFIEKDKRKINVSKMKKFGLKEGPLVGNLQEGKSIVFKGKKIVPDDVSTIVKGKKITFISDTIPCKNADLLAKDADLLICEATYSSDLEEKSREYFHMTSKQAAELASRCNVKKLMLTHFSARYKNLLELEEDARNYFDNTICAEDLMKISL
ncbi:MAG: ribonuclease Z [Candidatus Thorarchaeota archaeon]